MQPLLLIWHMLTLRTAFLLLCVTVWGQTYAERERSSPYEIFTSPLDNQLQERTPQINKVLFITSWNPQGHFYALKYAHKFDVLVICWYDLKVLPDGYLLTKELSFDQSLIPLIRKGNPKLIILLRIYLINSARQVFEYLGSNDQKNVNIAKNILETVRKVKANGVYYDSPFDMPRLRLDQTNRKYEMLAVACSIYLSNLIKQNMNLDQTMLYALRSPGREKIDFGMMAKVKTDGFVVSALENSRYEQSAFYGMELIANLRRIHSAQKYYLLLPFFSRRNGIGMTTTDAKKHLQKNGIAQAGFKNGICVFIETQNAAISHVPCYYYFQKMLLHAENYNIGVAFYEAGDAIEKYFQFL